MQKVRLDSIACLHALPSQLTRMVVRNQNSCFDIRDWSRWSMQKNSGYCASCNLGAMR